MNVVYSPKYGVSIGPHVFPTVKYRLVYEQLISNALIRRSDLVEPTPAAWDDLALVHTGEYLRQLRDGTLPTESLAELELPWSAEMVEGFRTMVGGTILAARLATAAADRPQPRASIVCHIGGGLHHAFPNHGEGFCPFNDVAVAIRVLQRDSPIERAAIVDLDVHHGNGTAFIFESDTRVFTFSMHQQHNYPMWKPRSRLDVGLEDGVGDERFLDDLESALPTVMASRPEVVFYLAGADPYQDDQLGGLKLTKNGLRHRDRIVIGTAARAGVPLVVVLAGGYARNVADTVAIHCATVEAALEFCSAPADVK